MKLQNYNNKKLCKDSVYLYIKTGYRKQLSYYDCIYSIFYIHNETINIWSHLATSILFMILYINNITNNITNNNIANTYLLVSSFGFLSSSIFHIFVCNKNYYKFALCIDSTGMFTNIFISVYSSLLNILSNKFLINYYNFYIIFYIIYIFIAYLIFIKKIIQTNHVTHISQSLAILTSIFYYKLPLFHLYFISKNDFLIIYNRWISMCIMWVFSFFIFGIRLPERFISYKFDYILNSHNIFHLLISYCAWIHYNTLYNLNT